MDEDETLAELDAEIERPIHEFAKALEAFIRTQPQVTEVELVDHVIDRAGHKFFYGFVHDSTGYSLMFGRTE